MRLQITVLYIRCEMTPTYAGGEQQECLFLYGMNNKG